MLTHKNLPEWLSSILFQDWGAKYSPNYDEYQQNLLLTDEQLKVYLGTYFPRSYAESYCIFSNLFLNSRYQNLLGNKQKFTFLTIGCGTGGDVIGFLDAVTDALPQIKDVSIQAIDGNFSAIDKLNLLIKRPELQCKFEKLMIDPSPIAINSLKDIKLLCSLVKGDFDFISSFKFINELISTHLLKNDAYGFLCNELAPKLSEVGILLFEDLTRKMDDGAWLPCIMNTSMRNFIIAHKDFKTIVPIPCHIYDTICNRCDCYTQLIFSDGKSSSKVCYRMISRSSAADSIYPLSQIGNAFYKLNPNGQNCMMTKDRDIIRSIFDLTL